jgi:hypothetical protein
LQKEASVADESKQEASVADESKQEASVADESKQEATDLYTAEEYAVHRAVLDQYQKQLESAAITANRFAAFASSSSSGLAKEESVQVPSGGLVGAGLAAGVADMLLRAKTVQERLENFQPRPQQPPSLPPLHLVEPEYADAPRIRSPTRPPKKDIDKDKGKGKGKGLNEMVVPEPLPPPRRLTLPRGMAEQIPCRCGRRGALATISGCGVCGTCCKEGGICEDHNRRELEKAERSRGERGGRTPSSSSWSWWSRAEGGRSSSWGSDSWRSESWASDSW